jgi:hypothetical protein
MRRRMDLVCASGVDESGGWGVEAVERFRASGYGMEVSGRISLQITEKDSPMGFLLGRSDSQRPQRFRYIK